MKLIEPIKGERHIELFWQDPYVLKNGELAIHAVEQLPLPENTPGLYMALGDDPLKGQRSLLYIGKTDRLIKKRISEHHWLAFEWRAEIYTANCTDRELWLTPKSY
ncbi:hypothetical protein MJD09_11740 [bacterium]|nr:hypothetical protein [bacterium]